MEYTVELNGKEYSLPTFKKSVRKEIERVTAGNESKKESDKKSLDMYLLCLLYTSPSPRDTR